MDALAARLGAEPELAHDYGEALERFLALGGDDFAARARAALGEVGLEGRLDDDAATLSGGEAARAALAAILLARFDVFLLDEPTNNLDFDGLDRLERFLDRLDAGVVLVSHDRAFLDRTANRIVELEAETRRVREYAGSWSDYERERRRRPRAGRSAPSPTTSRSATASRPSSSTAATRRALGGAQADRRGTHALMTKVRQAEKRLERLERVDKPWTPWRLQLSLPAGERAGDVVAELSGAVVERGAFRLGPIDLDLRWGDRLAVVGRNGTGKTTLLRALARRPAARARLAADRTVDAVRRARPGPRDVRSATASCSTSSSRRRASTRRRRGRCSRSSRSGPTTSPARSRRSRRASARALRWHCSRHAASTAWSSTSRRTTSTSRRSRSSRRRSSATRGRSSS